MMGERECGWEHCEFWIMAQFTLDIALPVELHHRLAERDASIRNLETLRDVHRRTIDDLISEAQTAGATIDELRAEAAGHDKRWQERADLITQTSELRHRATTLEAEAEGFATRYIPAFAAVEAERDRARGFAADLEAENAHALAEVSRLREQGEAAAAAIESLARSYAWYDVPTARAIRTLLDAREGE